MHKDVVSAVLGCRPVTADWPRCYKTFCMLSSAEHEILNAHKYKISRNLSFSENAIFPAHKY